MDIQGYDALLHAATQEDTPKARLKSLLLAVRDSSFAEDVDSVSIWITGREEDGPDAALALLRGADLEFPQDDNDKEVGSDVVKANAPPAAAYSVEVPEPSDSQTKVVGYLHFSSQPHTSEQWLQAAARLIGRALLELKRERTEERAYAILNSYREKMFHDPYPEKTFQSGRLVGQADLDKLGEEIAAAFCSRALWVMLYDFQSWRSAPHGGPLVTFQGHHRPFESVPGNFYQLLNKEIYKLFRIDKGSNLKSVEREVQLSELPGEFGGLRFFVTAVPLAYPNDSDDSAGIPYIAVVTLNEPGLGLDEQGQSLLERLIVELQRVLRFRDELEHVKGIGILLQQFLSLSSPIEIANSIVEHLSKTFNATEVAILERRGMFLSVIGQKNVPLRAIPPLHIPTTPARVCEVAQKGEKLYDENVRRTDSYLPVVSSTKTQFTVPLIWRGDLVGVLLLGLGVIDGLEPRHRKIVESLAGYCAAAIAGSQRTLEERAVSHMLGEVLTGAALKIDQVIDSNENSPPHHARLRATFDLLDQCQAFIDNFRNAQVTKQKGRVDLRRVVADYADAPILANQLQEHPDCSLDVRPLPEQPLIAYAHEEGIQLALHNIVVNGLEAMGGTSGKITISLDAESKRYQSSRKQVHFGVIKITDEGGGIPLSEQAKIFDLFYSTKQNHMGSGLSIAARIIEGFGGRVELRSPVREDDRGCEFSLWIPVARKGGKKSE